MRTLSQLNTALRKRGISMDFYGGPLNEGFLFESLESAPEHLYDTWWGYLRREDFTDPAFRKWVCQQGDAFIAYHEEQA